MTMSQHSFDFPLTKFERATALYFSEGKKPSDQNIALAIKKCKLWCEIRNKKGLKPYT